MPSYNEDRYIESAIRALQGQTYKDWILFISDNSSNDNTEMICKHLANVDKRIIYHQQEKNIGLTRNFEYVAHTFLNKYKSEYFMWAQADDLWDEDFLEECLTLLESDITAGVAFSAMDNIDAYSRVVRQYESFGRFSTPKFFWNRFKYLFEPEILGKGNIFLGLYRRSVIADIILSIGFSIIYSDYVVAYKIISDSRLVVTDKVLFHKRIDSKEDKKSHATPIIVKSIKNGVFPLHTHLSLHYQYFRSSKRFSRNFLVFIAMLYRLPRSLVPTSMRLASWIRRALVRVYNSLFHF